MTNPSDKSPEGGQTWNVQHTTGDQQVQAIEHVGAEVAPPDLSTLAGWAELLPHQAVRFDSSTGQSTIVDKPPGLDDDDEDEIEETETP